MRGTAGVRCGRSAGALAVVIALLLVASVAAGCGESGAGAASPPASGPPGSPAALAPSTSPSPSSAAPVSVHNVVFSQGGLRLKYQTPTLQTEDNGQVPVSMNGGLLAFDPRSNEYMTPVILVPSDDQTAGAVMVLTYSQKPKWIAQVKGMSQSEFAQYLPQLEQSIRDSIGKQVKKYPGPQPKGLELTSGTANGVPAVIMTLSTGAGSTRVRQLYRVLITRHDLYVLGFLVRKGISGKDRTALRKALDSASVKW